MDLGRFLDLLWVQVLWTVRACVGLDYFGACEKLLGALVSSVSRYFSSCVVKVGVSEWSGLIASWHLRCR